MDIPLAASLALAIAALPIAASAGAAPDENSICGAIESGQLTIPSYRFKITDQRGKPVSNLSGQGQLDIVEGVWRGHWYEGQWDDEHHYVTLRVAYDADRDQYVSEELPKVKLTRRKKGFAMFKTSCWDRVKMLTFSFRPAGDAQTYAGQFIF